MKIVLLNVEQAQSIYRSQMVRDFPESELKPFASVQGMMTRGLYEPLAFYDEAGALMAYAWQAVLPQCRNVLLDYFASFTSCACCKAEASRTLRVNSISLESA